MQSRSRMKNDGLGSARAPITQPYDAASTLDFFRRRAIPGVEQVEGLRYCRTTRVDGEAGWLSMDIDSANGYLTVCVETAEHMDSQEVLKRAVAMFDVDADAKEMERILGADPVLDSLAMRGMRVPGTWNPFELGVRAILGQQVTVAAARTLASRLCEKFGGHSRAGAPSGLIHTFPTAETVAEVDVGPIGMPRRRAETIRLFARAVASGEIDLDSPLGRKEAPRQLLEIPGIGKWTVGYFTMRALKEPDAFPSADIALIRAAQNLGIAHDARSLDRAAERWRPWRAYAAVRLWGSLSAK